MIQISIENFTKMVDYSQGYCTTCKDFTRDCTEPDAENYECPVCGKNTVIGAEYALLMGFISFEEGEYGEY
jgi:predicted RNA-binding Zn-ribbon protein involved in translation (DUF1610 family)